MTNLVTEKQTQAGVDISNLLFDASLSKVLGQPQSYVPKKYRDLVEAYLEGSLKSVDCIYLVMKGAEND